jgi:hypothetical protein
MENDVPEFNLVEAKRRALPFVNSIFTDKLSKLEIADDGRCRAIFKKSFFTLNEGETEPSKSQWSTLKKKLKRHNRGVFIFKETGETACAEGSSDKCFYIDFGFYRY